MRATSSHGPASKCSEAGSAMVELALLCPLLLLMLFGSMDFARVFYTSIAVANAARAGAGYGAQSVSKTTDFAGMQSAAAADASNVQGFTATATRVCQCASGASSDCSVGSCPAGKLLIYAQVTARATYQTVGAYPGIPRTISLQSIARMRAQ